MQRTNCVRHTIIGLVMFAPAIVLVSMVGVPNAAASYQPSNNPFANPSQNMPAPPLTYGSGLCTGQEVNGIVSNCSSPCYPSVRVEPNGDWIFPLADTPACTDLALKAINAAQASEHLPPLVLPRNYFHMNVAEQLFVLANLERVIRGVPPLVGLVPYLNYFATIGARLDEDPFVSRLDYNYKYNEWQTGPIIMAHGMLGGTSIWDGGDSTPASAMFGWMYNDGWGGSAKATTNFDCTSPHASGCWGHRDNILGADLGTKCTTCFAGAGFASSLKPGSWTTSYAMIFVEAVNHPAVSFSWNANVLPELPVRYERVPAG